MPDPPHHNSLTDFSTLLMTLIGNTDPNALNSLLNTTDPNVRTALLQALLHNQTSPITPTPTSPTTPPTTTASVTTLSTTTTDDDNPEDTFILSQSEVLPPTFSPPISTTRINSSSGIITSFLEETRTLHDNDLAMQSRRIADGRVYTPTEANKRMSVVLKIAMPASANSDQAPTTSTLEPVIDAIINSLAFPFTVDIVALLNYDKPINNAKRTASTYFSFVYLSPRSTQKHITSNASNEYALLYARLADLVMGPNQAIRNIPTLPPISTFLTITTPNINDMNERLEFLIDGVGPRTILGPNEWDNTDTYRHLGYLILIALKDCWKRNMPTRPLPDELYRLQTRNQILHVISTKKVRMTTPENTPKVHNMLGVVLTTTEPYTSILRNAFTELCITNKHPLQLFGILNSFEIHLHTFPDTNDQTRFTLGRTINTHNHQLHQEHQFKQVRNVRIHPKFLQYHRHITQSVLCLDDCIAIFCDFSAGHSNLLLTTIFTTGRTTSYLNADTITSKIKDNLRHVLDLTPSPLPPSLPATPPRNTYANTTRKNPYHSPPGLTPPTRTPGRGRGRNTTFSLPSLNPQRQIITDRSLGHL